MIRSTRPENGIKNVDDCVKWLDSVLLMPDGTFKYSVAVRKLKDIHERREIGDFEYLELFEACEHRKHDGHYRNSYAYRYAEGRIL